MIQYWDKQLVEFAKSVYSEINSHFTNSSNKYLKYKIYVDYSSKLVNRMILNNKETVKIPKQAKWDMPTLMRKLHLILSSMTHAEMKLSDICDYTCQYVNFTTRLTTTPDDIGVSPDGEHEVNGVITRNVPHINRDILNTPRRRLSVTIDTLYSNTKYQPIKRPILTTTPLIDADIFMINSYTDGYDNPKQYENGALVYIGDYSKEAQELSKLIPTLRLIQIVSYMLHMNNIGHHFNQLSHAWYVQDCIPRNDVSVMANYECSYPN